MIDRRLRVRALLVAGAVAALAATSGVAMAAPGPSQAPACSRLPLSQRGICKVESTQRSQSREARAPSAAQRAANASADARYRSAVAECNRLPLSQRGICKERALSVRETSSPPDRVALDRETHRFQSDVKQCGRLPLSQRPICRSEAGMSETLAARA